MVRLRIYFVKIAANKRQDLLVDHDFIRCLPSTIHRCLRRHEVRTSATRYGCHCHRDHQRAAEARCSAGGAKIVIRHERTSETGAIRQLNSSKNISATPRNTEYVPWWMGEVPSSCLPTISHYVHVSGDCLHRNHIRESPCVVQCHCLRIQHLLLLPTIQLLRRWRWVDEPPSVHRRHIRVAIRRVVQRLAYHQAF